MAERIVGYVVRAAVLWPMVVFLGLVVQQQILEPLQGVPHGLRCHRCGCGAQTVEPETQRVFCLQCKQYLLTINQ